MRGSFESEMTFYSFCPDHVPKPIAWGNYESDTTTWFYLCDFHDMIDDLPGPDDLVPVIADVQTARVAKPSNNNFNFLADIHNDDKWQVSWELQFTQAMRRMFSHEEQLRGKDDRLTELREDLFEKVIPRLLRPLETSGHSLQPCLIHSDLCPSSVMVDEDTSKVMIFDSCAYWSHNEAELGTWRSTQNKSGPPYSSEYIVKMGISEPVEDWDDRNALRYILLLSTMYPDDPKFRTMAMWEMQRLVDKFPMGYEGNQFVSP
ncbi:hypothetical protein B0H66DRAFT_304929 [Apodospora peruviana]|uniref:protein-ribulosamine 3-kinase n=1 Tax=Apodospora peruviana TaxID=516989 RepID=A0AAE0I1A6_9PEZI|nr:hypothetical protein B0H66DRAFT_304929 [Apodospora peruviana]